MKKYTTSESKELVTLRKRAMKDGGYSLMLDYTVEGVRKREFLKMYLVPEKTPVDRYQNQETLKTANAAKAKRIVELQNGVAGFRKRKGEKIALVDYMDERVAYYRKRGSRYFAQNVLNTKAYCISYRGKDTRLSQVTKEYLLGFIDHLNDSELGDGTIYTYFNALLIVLNAAVREDLIAENPSKRIDSSLKPKEKESTRAFLSIEEVRRLMNTPCEDETLKSAFLFSCFTGLRISDVRALTWEKVIDVDGGKKQIQVTQTKTGGVVNIPLSENALHWLPEKKGEFVFPDLPFSPTLDRKIDKWAQAAEIEKHVTFHVARHTNATLLLTYGADIYTVSELLGHKNVSTTKIYAKIVDEKKRKAVDMIPDL